MGLPERDGDPSMPRMEPPPLTSPSRPLPTRRSFLGALAATAVSAATPARALALGAGERAISFLHTHTNEALTVAYFADGAYLPEGLARLDGFLRDHRTGEEHPIDPALFDVLWEVRRATGARGAFQVISGYRSPRTNDMLRGRSRGVAGGSLHLQGRAIDVRLADVGTAVLRDAALELARGGVGYYRSSDFVHLDTGRVRRW